MSMNHPYYIWPGLVTPIAPREASQQTEHNHGSVPCPSSTLARGAENILILILIHGHGHGQDRPSRGDGWDELLWPLFFLTPEQASPSTVHSWSTATPRLWTLARCPAREGRGHTRGSVSWFLRVEGLLGLRSAVLCGMMLSMEVGWRGTRLIIGSGLVRCFDRSFVSCKACELPGGWRICGRSGRLVRCIGECIGESSCRYGCFVGWHLWGVYLYGGIYVSVVPPAFALAWCFAAPLRVGRGYFGRSEGQEGRLGDNVLCFEVESIFRLRTKEHAVSKRSDDKVVTGTKPRN